MKVHIVSMFSVDNCGYKKINYNPILKTVWIPTQKYRGEGRHEV